MQKEYVIQFYKTINKLLCNLSFAGQYILQATKTFATFLGHSLSCYRNLVKYHSKNMFLKESLTRS